ncbi:MAG: hypothetical protein WEE50_06855 [Chloroflexota bacterium]
MTTEPERIKVPTNGKGPHHVDEPSTPDPSPSDELTVAFTPTQIAVGFGIVASLVLLLARQLRRSGRRGRR